MARTKVPAGAEAAEWSRRSRPFPQLWPTLPNANDTRCACPRAFKDNEMRIKIAYAACPVREHRSQARTASLLTLRLQGGHR